MSETKENAMPGRWVRVVLIASLALNLAVGAAFIGSHLADREDGRRGEGALSRGFSVGPLGRAFSKEDRAELRRAFAGKLPQMRAGRQQMREVGAALADALRAQPYDEGAVRDVLARQLRIQGELQGAAQEVMLARFAAMTPDARAGFADRLEKGLRRRH